MRYTKTVMLKRIFAIILLFTVFATPFASSAAVFNPNFLISDEEFTNIFSMDLGQIQEFLSRGSLATYMTEDLDGKKRYAADIIWRTAQRNGVNPQVILVMLQKEQSLVLDPDPSEDQLDWAMGYAVCDSCTHDDPTIQRFRGFAKQVNSATLQFSEGYLTDLAANGETVTGLAPGQATLIDDVTVIPANNATAALYTYTPHLHGNQNFVTLWQQWFIRHYPGGSLLQNKENGAVWLIQYDERRPITSRTAFVSRFADKNIISVDPSELEVYPIGSPISLPNYSLLHAENGDIYLLVDDAIRHITSMEAFRSIGFNTDDLIDVTEDDLQGYTLGEPITSDSLYPQGVLLQDTKTGGVFYVENGEKFPILSREILTARFVGRPLIPTKPSELDVYPKGNPVLFSDGTLMGVKGSPEVFFISEGKRRPILNGTIFETFGWKWENVIWTNEASILVHPLGSVISNTTMEEMDPTEILTASR